MTSSLVPDNMTSSLSVIVTGCSTGIGNSIAIHLARQGHVVFATMRNALHRKEGYQLQQISSSENLSLFVVDLDVDNATSCSLALGKCLHLAPHGRIDVLINNAGVGGKVGPVEETETEDFERIMRTSKKKIHFHFIFFLSLSDVPLADTLFRVPLCSFFLLPFHLQQQQQQQQQQQTTCHLSVSLKCCFLLCVKMVFGKNQMDVEVSEQSFFFHLLLLPSRSSPQR